MIAKEELDRCTDEQLDKLIEALGIVYSGSLDRNDKITMILANANKDRLKILIDDICCKK